MDSHSSKPLTLSLLMFLTLLSAAAWSQSDVPEDQVGAALMQDALQDESIDHESPRQLQSQGRLPALEPLADRMLRLYKQAEWVSLVKVTQVRQRINVSLSRAGMYSVDSFIYNLVVLGQWKGDGVQAVQLELPVEDCPNILEYQGEYIIFGQGSSDHLHGISCEDLIPYTPESDTTRTLMGLGLQSASAS